MSDEIERDRFGLPIHETIIHGGADVYEREALVAQLVSDVVAAVVRQVGKHEAQRRFTTEFERLNPPPPPQGKREDRLRNADLLYKLDALIASGVPSKLAAGRLAQAECASHPMIQPASLARHIRQIARAREIALQEYDDAQRPIRDGARRTVLGGNSDL